MTTQLTRAEVAPDRLPADDEVFARIDEYRRSVARLREYESARDRGGPVDARAHLVAAEAVLDARTGLYRCLLGHGWSPPGGVIADLVRDEAVAREGTGAVGG